MTTRHCLGMFLSELEQLLASPSFSEAHEPAHSAGARHQAAQTDYVITDLAARLRGGSCVQHWQTHS